MEIALLSGASPGIKGWVPIPDEESECTRHQQGTVSLHTQLGQVDEWDSLAEVGGERKEQYITTTSQCR